MDRKCKESYGAALMALTANACRVVLVEELSKVVRSIPKSSNGTLFKCYSNLLRIAREQKVVHDSVSEVDLSMMSMSSNSVQPP